jgi:pyruvate formate lyase activating enzyme
MSLIDYPQKISCVLFTQGCLFNCPFCHNPDLIPINKQKKSLYQEDEVLDFLKKRQGLLDGLVITGGEPTIQSDLLDFIKKAKRFNLLVKLDTMGINPGVVESAVNRGLVDYIAMDIKHTPKKYFQAIGTKSNLVKIEQSIDIIKNSGIDYEFRTTCVPGIHSEEDFFELADWLEGSKNYYIQEFRDTVTNDPGAGEKARKYNLDLEKIKEIMQKKISNVQIRRNN